MKYHTLICGHRGARREAPENTLEAFERCIAMGADMIELDVRCTRDGEIVVHHDPAILGVPICDRDWLDIYALRGQLGFSVPLFSEVLDLCRGRIGLDVEIKEPGFENDLLALTGECPQGDRCFFSSFYDSVISRIRQLDSRVPTGLLLGSSRPRQYGHSHWESIHFEHRVDRCSPDWLLFNIWQLPFGVLGRAAPLGLRVGVWTENRPRHWQKLINDPRVHMLITDLPREALRVRETISP